MTPELKWLAATCALTTLMWLPYILNLISVRGLSDAMGYPKDPAPMAAWAERLKMAHYNAIENLVVFGLLVVVAHLANVHSSTTVIACVTYFLGQINLCHCLYHGYSGRKNTRLRRLMAVHTDDRRCGFTLIPFLLSQRTAFKRFKLM